MAKGSANRRFPGRKPGTVKADAVHVGVKKRQGKPALKEAAGTRQRRTLWKEEAADELLAELLAKAGADTKLAKLQYSLGYTFREPRLLELALTHRTANRVAHNARLAWLGDSVMQLVITEMLYEAKPDATAGELTKARSLLETRRMCAALGGRLGLGKLLVQGLGGRRRSVKPQPSMMAEAMEALLGAVYVDSGLRMGAVKRVYAAIGQIQQVAQQADPSGARQDRARSQQPGQLEEEEEEKEVEMRVATPAGGSRSRPAQVAQREWGEAPAQRSSRPQQRGRQRLQRSQREAVALPGGLATMQEQQQEEEVQPSGKAKKKGAQAVASSGRQGRAATPAANQQLEEAALARGQAQLGLAVPLLAKRAQPAEGNLAQSQKQDGGEGESPQPAKKRKKEGPQEGRQEEAVPPQEVQPPEEEEEEFPRGGQKERKRGGQKRWQRQRGQRGRRERRAGREQQPRASSEGRSMPV